MQLVTLARRTFGISLLVTVGLAGALLASDTAFAWVAVPPKSRQPAPNRPRFQETQHTIKLRQTEGSVEATIRRSFQNQSDREVRMHVELPLPRHAAITSFRSKSRGRWVAAQLLRAKGAQKRFDALQKLRLPNRRPPPGARAETAPALLTLSRVGFAYLRVPRVPRRGTVEIEYTIVGPLCYGFGEHLWVVPELPQKNVTLSTVEPTVTLKGEPVTLDSVMAPNRSRALLPQSGCAGESFPPAFPLPTPTPPPPGASSAATALMLALRGTDAPVTARWATERVSAHQVLARLEFELPIQIQPPPRRPSVVFLLDASRSLNDVGLVRQFGFVKILASRYDDAMVQVVTFNRSARLLFPKFVRAANVARAIARVPSHALTLSNGSNVSVGLAKSAAALRPAAVRRRGDRRIVAFTDGAFPAAFRADEAIDALGDLRDAITLNIAYDGGSDGSSLSEAPPFRHRMDPVATATGGTSVVLNGPIKNTPAAHWVLRHLVTPTRLDDFRIEGPRSFRRALTKLRVKQGIQRRLGGGFGQTLLLNTRALAAARGGVVRLTGKLWGRKWHVDVPFSPSLKRRLGALAVGDGTADRLAPGPRFRLARDAGVASAETSFLTPGSVRVPVANDPVPRHPMPKRPRFRSFYDPPSEQKSAPSTWYGERLGDLQKRVRAHLRACTSSAADPNGAVAIETTTNEVVAVEAHSRDDKTARCMDKWAWRLKLDAEAYNFDARFFVKVTP